MLNVMERITPGRFVSRLRQFTNKVTSAFILLVVAIIWEIASCVLLLIVMRLCGCVLFGKVFERKRILEGGRFRWCVLPVVLHIASIACLFLYMMTIRKGKIGSSNSLCKAVGSLAVSAVLTFLASLIISSGFQTFCDSFVINSCSYEHIHAMDWRKFTPKYSDCGALYIYMEGSKMSSWISCFLLCILFMIHLIRLLTGLHTSSRWLS